MGVAFSAAPAFTTPVVEGPPPDTGGNLYFDALVERSDFWKGLALRPEAGDTDPASPYFVDQLLDSNDGGYQEQSSTYSGFEPLAFTYDATEDAAKLVMPPFLATATALIADIDSSTTTLPCNNTVNSTLHAINIYLKLDAEIVKITARDTALDTITVLRAQAGTTAAAHLSGTLVLRGTNSTPSTIVLPLGTNNEATRLFFVWDVKFDTSFMGLSDAGLQNFKAYQISSAASTIWFEPDTAFQPIESQPTYNPATDVAAYHIRSYTGVIAAPMTDDEPVEPIAGYFAFKPNKWTRFFVLLKIKARNDATAYYDSLADVAGGGIAAVVSDATLASGVSSGATLLTCTSAATAVEFEATFAVGAYLRIDSENFLISASDGTAKTITVTGAQAVGGSTSIAAAHSAGAVVSPITSITFDCTSLYGASAVACFGNRLYVKIESEYLRVIGNPTGSTTRTMYAMRAAFGTTGAAHASGVAVYNCANCLASAWIADEDRDPVAHFLDMPMSVLSTSTASQENSIADFEFEWNTSQDDCTGRADRSLVSWHRNLAVLKSTTIDPDAEGLLVKPS